VADPEARIRVEELQLPAITVIDKAFGNISPQQTIELKELIQRKL
jgi:hypothetical protein